MIKLRIFLIDEKSKFKIFPHFKDIFNAFLLTPFNKVKLIILGQDPYHNVGQAHGLSFSVLNHNPPPSLINVFKELKSDLGIESKIINKNSGDLSPWASQGVFLLNSVLTVRAHQAASHRNQGWEILTDKVIKILNQKRNNLVFFLWGKYAHEKIKFIDSTRHYVLNSSHPSPFSAHRGFFGCKHFSLANEYLSNNNIKPIDWTLP